MLNHKKRRARSESSYRERNGLPRSPLGYLKVVWRRPNLYLIVMTKEGNTMTGPKPEPGLEKRKVVLHNTRCVQCWQRQATIVERMRRLMNRQNGPSCS